MPRKRSEVPHALRIRENQRRSRVRKKELIEDLQSRLHDYEKEQVQATILVQRAARKVVWENAQLRRLLAKLGIDGQQIVEFLNSQSQAEPQRLPVKTVSQAFPSPISSNADSKCKSPIRGPTLLAIQSTIPPSLSLTKAVSTVQSDTSNRGLNHRPAIVTEPLPSSGSKNINGESDCSTAYPLLNLDSLDRNILPSVSDCFCPELAQDQSAQDKMGTMSCEAAASIIAGMREHNDEEQALRELGCEQDVNCQIKSTRVLQVMAND